MPKKREERKKRAPLQPSSWSLYTEAQRRQITDKTVKFYSLKAGISHSQLVVR